MLGTETNPVSPLLAAQSASSRRYMKEESYNSRPFAPPHKHNVIVSARTFQILLLTVQVMHHFPWSSLMSLCKVCSTIKTKKNCLFYFHCDFSRLLFSCYRDNEANCIFFLRKTNAKKCLFKWKLCLHIFSHSLKTVFSFMIYNFVLLFKKFGSRESC